MYTDIANVCCLALICRFGFKIVERGRKEIRTGSVSRRSRVSKNRLRLNLDKLAEEGVVLNPTVRSEFTMDNNSTVAYTAVEETDDGTTATCITHNIQIPITS